MERKARCIPQALVLGKTFNIFTSGLGIENKKAVIKYIGFTKLDTYQHRGAMGYCTIESQVTFWTPAVKMSAIKYH